MSSRLRFAIPLLVASLQLSMTAVIVHAQTTPSDRLTILDSSGSVIFDASIPETSATAGETHLIYQPAGTPPVTIAPQLIREGVVLLDPIGEPHDPSERCLKRRAGSS